MARPTRSRPTPRSANCNYALTDYTEERGAWPWCRAATATPRQPTSCEVWLDGNRRYAHVIPIEVPAGTAILWHGNTWHGSFPRKVPGLRVNLSCYFCREYIQPQENYRDHVPEGFLDGENGRQARAPARRGPDPRLD